MVCCCIGLNVDAGTAGEWGCCCGEGTGINCGDACGGNGVDGWDECDNGEGCDGE